MLDFSNLYSNLEGSSFTSIITISLVSFVLSSLIALTYQKTSREIESPKYFIQSLILISIPVASVMQAIGDSLARGLGMLGALAIIRFRTTLKSTINIVFMFTSITVGIACGVYGIPIAILGTLCFCFVVLLIHFSPLSKTNYVMGDLEFDIIDAILETNNTQKEIEKFLKENCIKYSLTKYGINGERKKKKELSLRFQVKVIDKEKAKYILDKLSSIEKVYNLKINFKDDYEKI